MCKADYLDTLQPGDILPCTVTHIDRLARSVMWLRHQCPAAHRLHVGEPHLLPRRPGERGPADLVRRQEPGCTGALC